MSFLHACWQITLDLAPWLLLGALAGGMLHIFLPTGWLHRQLQGRWGVVKSVLLGVPLPLCSCGVIPVGLSLRKSGASTGASVGFLISTPQTGVDSILVSANMLGWPFALFKVAAAAVTGVVGGWAADAVDKPLPNMPIADDQQEQPPERSVAELLRYSLTLLQSLWRWLVVGIVVSALITVLVPQDMFSGLSIFGSLAAMLITLLISLPMYVCATASVPIAASLVASGLPPGAALVFLMAGPATNLATIGAVRKALGGRALAVYMAVIIAGSVAAGLLFETVVPSTTVIDALHDHVPSWWSIACAVLLIALVAHFAWKEAAAAIARRRLPADGQGTLTVGVQGMTCTGCIEKLETTLRASDKVTAAAAKLAPGSVTVAGQLSSEELRGLVRDAGFTPLT